MQKSILLPLAFLFLFFSCNNDPEIKTASISSNSKAKTVSLIPDEFNDYWYAGNAELTSYKLEQARYGEMRSGELVTIFVTEDFSKSKQVKLDNPSQNPKDAAPVLKMNLTKKFNTGLYPYSMMTSVFTPVDQDNRQKSLKISTSSQEWCGHTFHQLNLKKNTYEQTLHSYFESEGEQNNTIKESTILEDEIFNLIRMNPANLPQDKIMVIPSTMFLRLIHQKTRPTEVNAILKQDPNNANLSIYALDFIELDRKLEITFNKAFPYEILGWEDSYKDGWGANAKVLTTKATKKKSIKSAYWSKNSNSDDGLRAALDLLSK